MSVDKINAALMLLKARALETYGVMKDYNSKQSEFGDAGEIANLALSLVQYEGAYLTLQQHAEDMLAAEAALKAADGDTEEAKAEVPEPTGKTIVPTAETSPTFRKSQENRVTKGRKVDE